MLAIRDIHIKDEVFRDADETFQRLINSCEDGREPFALVIASPSGAGKTHILNHLATDKRLVAFRDEFGVARPLIRMSAPSPCTMKTLGIQLLRMLTGQTINTKYNAHEIWTRVRTNLYNQNTSIIMIDEMNHVFETVDEKTRQIVISTLKALLVGEVEMDDGLIDEIGALPPSVVPHPIGLVLSGMPSVRDVIDIDLQLKRRCRFKTLRPLTLSKAGEAKFGAFVAKVGSKLGFEPAPDLGRHDMMLRLHKASGGYRGRAAFLIKEAAFLAIDSGARTVTQEDHFARVFEEIYEVGDLRNPFLVPVITKLAPIPEIEREPKSRLRGKKTIPFEAVD